MSKELLAVDIDEVFFPYVREFAVHHNQKYATKLLTEHFTSYHFEEVVGLTVDETMQRVYDFNELDHSDIEPIVDAKEGIKRLTKRFDVELLTARHPRFEVQTQAWLKRHFSDTFHGLTMIGHELATDVKPQTKAQVCRGIGATALVDDSLRYIAQAAEIGVPGILFGDYPWNQTEVLPTGVIRVAGWNELAEHFNV